MFEYITDITILIIEIVCSFIFFMVRDQMLYLTQKKKIRKR